MAIGDFDNDGLKDIAVSNLGENSIYLYKNHSDQNTVMFIKESEIVLENTPLNIEAGDFNGSAYDELVVSYLNSPVLDIYTIDYPMDLTFELNTSFAGDGFIEDIQVGKYVAETKESLLFIEEGSTSWKMLFK